MLEEKRVLVTGSKGMAGSYLTELLESMPEYKVLGIDLPDAPDLRDLSVPHGEYADCDVRKWDELYEVFKEFRPHWVFHLAALAFVPYSWDDPNAYVETNIGGTVHVLEAAVAMRPMVPIVQVACSSEEYGMVHRDEVPIQPSQPFRPLSPYGVTKVAAELFAKQYWESYHVLTVPTRTFNHTGPRQSRLYVLSDFCAMAVEVKKGKRRYINHGSLESVRDFTDVRDVVRGYLKAVQWAEKANAGGVVHQIGGGAVVSIRYLLEQVCQIAGLNVDEHTALDEKRLRPSDVKLLQCDATIFTNRTGWRPTIPLEQTIADTLNYWEERL